MNEIRVHTNFTNSISVIYTIPLAELTSVEARQRLRWCFLDPDKLRPTATREAVTREAAKVFGDIAKNLRDQGHDPHKVAHFLNRLIFCLFAEDIDLLPDRIFADILEESVKSADSFEPMLRELFRLMKDKGGRFGTVSIPWFNGGLFDNDEVLPLRWSEIRSLQNAAKLDWSAIEPSIFGTLFEVGLDPGKREIMASLFDFPSKFVENLAKDSEDPNKGVGIHYTDSATIMKIIDPVIIEPLRRSWADAKEKIAEHRERRDRAKSSGAKTAAENAARLVWTTFREYLGRFKVLDPACGSGNFLYLSLIKLKDFDLEILNESTKLGLPLDDQRVTPKAVAGIEINPYAAELARVTIWIGELQWQINNSFDHLTKRTPILGRLDTIECRDAILNEDGSEAAWPKVDVIVGNPPFLGDKPMRGSLGDDYVRRLRSRFADRLPAGVDLVTYWFEKSREELATGRIKLAGLVSTQTIRRGANRTALDRIAKDVTIFSAWSNEPWVVDGAAVRVSLICFGSHFGEAIKSLDGKPVEKIHADLSGTESDFTKCIRLSENRGICRQGTTKVGDFDIHGSIAREWLIQPINPNNQPNSQVLRPWLNGAGITDRNPDRWIIDFGCEMSASDAALYEKPFSYVAEHIKPGRLTLRRKAYRKFWWRHAEPRPGLRQSLNGLHRYIATPRVSKHRIFVWVPASTLPDSRVNAFARDDDLTFGILHSRFHELWSLRLSGRHGVGNDPQYTPSIGFETFPFPTDLTPDISSSAHIGNPLAEEIAAAARRLDELRATG